ncbi:Uncharacterized protein HZ326_27903, partial [Fusarium oxysporum f. sp. albedinis]
MIPCSRIISRNALRFLFLTNHRLVSSHHIFLDGNASRFRRLTLVGFNSLTTDLNNNIHYHRLLKLTYLSSPYSIYSISAIPS